MPPAPLRSPARPRSLHSCSKLPANFRRGARGACPLANVAPVAEPPSLRTGATLKIRRVGWEPDRHPPPGAPVPPILPPVDGSLLLDKAKFAASFAADVCSELASFMGIHSCRGASQRNMANRAGATTVEAPGSHAIYVSWRCRQPHRAGCCWHRLGHWWRSGRGSVGAPRSKQLNVRFEALCGPTVVGPEAGCPLPG